MDKVQRLVLTLQHVRMQEVLWILAALSVIYVCTFEEPLTL